MASLQVPAAYSHVLYSPPFLVYVSNQRLHILKKQQDVMWDPAQLVALW